MTEAPSPCYHAAVERPSDPPRPGTLLIAATVFYGLMSAAAIVVLALSDLDPGLVVFGPDLEDVASGLAPAPLSHPLAALLGAASGGVVVMLSLMLRRVGPIDRLHKEFSAVLGPLSTGTVAVLAVTSAVGEELLFRGALQPLIGFWPTAALFGLLHGGGTPRLFAWTVFAFLSGLLLGWLADFTGSLLAPILCHLTINFWNLQAIGERPREGTT